MSDIPTFFDYLFGDRQGWACLGAIDGDPQIEQIDGKHQEWFEWPANRDTMIRRAEWHAEQGHNLYVRQTLFVKRSGTKRNAQPSDILWQDDTRADTPCSVLIESSEGNYQALIRLDRLASTAERERMMRAWRNARPGADDCSANPVSFVRVPGGHNRKRHGDWLVRYAVRTSRIYNADRLLARCGEETRSSLVSAARAELHDAGAWHDLPDGWRHINSKRWQHIISGRPQLRTCLIEKKRVTITGRNGRPDDSGSAQVAVVVQNLITAQPRAQAEHLPEREIRAALLALKPLLRPGVSLYQYQVDVDWLINHYRPKNYTPRKTRYLGPAHCDVIKRPVGRPTHAPEVDRFFLFLRERIGDDTPVSRSALASEFDVHTRTIATYLEELRRDGRIAWARKSRGLVITFVTSDVIEIISAPAAPQPAPVPQIEQSAPCYGETGTPGVECVSPDRAKSDHISPAPLRLAELVNEAIEAYGSSLKRVRRYLADNGGGRAWPAAAVARVYQRQLQRRRWARRDAREAAKARELGSAALKRKSRSIASQAAEMHRRGDKRAPVYQHLAGIYAAEEARRAPPDQLTMHEEWAAVDMQAYEQGRPAQRFSSLAARAARLGAS